MYCAWTGSEFEIGHLPEIFDCKIDPKLLAAKEVRAPSY